MNWGALRVSPCGTHHVDGEGNPVYDERFDSVLRFHAPGLAPVRRDGLAWHIRPDGSAAYSRRFRKAFGFYEGLAAVESDDGWHHVTSDGLDAYPKRYAWCGNFQQGRCTVRNEVGEYFHIVKDGRPAYCERWRYAGDYRDGIAVVQAANGCSTHIDASGRILHGVWYWDLDVFHKGYARARDEDGWMHVDVRGRPIYARRFASVEPFYNGQARVERFDGALEVIDERGTTVRELRGPRRSEFAELSADLVGYWRTHTIAAAVELGVIEKLPGTAAEVAERCGLRLDGARRLLRALGELGLVTCASETWSLTERGRFLRADHPMTLADAALEYAGPMSVMWSRLADALRCESDWVAPDVFGEVARDEVRRVGYHRMLRSYARHDYADLASCLELRGDECVIDAGGGLGVLAQRILEAYPSAQVTVLERSEVVAMAPSVPGVRWKDGDLFAPWGIEADVVVLSRVLHDWGDDAACRILKRAREALAIGGRVYVLEMVLSEGGVAGAMCDLHLLAVTGGRERTADEFGRLLANSGFELVEVRKTPALPSVIVGVAR